MGEVYRARDTKLGREVAIKLAHELNILLGCPNTGRRLFLKRVKELHGLLKSNRVNALIRVSVMRLDDL